MNILTGQGRPIRGVTSASWFYGGPTNSDRAGNTSRDVTQVLGLAEIAWNDKSLG